MSAPGLARVLAAERMLFGGALLLNPTSLVQAVAGGQATPPMWIARLLGARLMGQGVAELAVPRARVLIAGSVIDLLHAASMLAPAVFTPRYRRVALASATEAVLAATVATAAARSAHDR